ncbi:hypothetical protein [Arthrobacter sp. H41]|nr:hypothetical protein [Arthrobacter sp. H41]
MKIALDPTPHPDILFFSDPSRIDNVVVHGWKDAQKFSAQKAGAEA